MNELFRFPYATVDELLAAIEDGKACNNQRHVEIIARLTPGTTIRCAVCNQPLSAAPIPIEYQPYRGNQ